jgi:hypothetical protein
LCYVSGDRRFWGRTETKEELQKSLEKERK